MSFKGFLLRSAGLIFCGGVIFGVLFCIQYGGYWLEALYRYDAATDVLPDSLWDAGAPGNPYIAH